MTEFNGTSLQFSYFVQQRPAVIAYFSTNDCQVCKVLKPRVAEMVEANFKQLNLVYISLDKHPDIAGQFRIFTVPTIVVFFEGREFLRKSRSFGVEELKNDISRPYHLMFS
ncbi:thioredoxin family protein [Mangrovibacterium lignilyticum]|uniref:thioredoxin family protein n=1 Tax=Mangrovibacterium lignilyticum TaxID=2668052 RepID=UPI0013D22596|nr:thioredoxin family protein [Mangrovibacterium lignilyticum]